ncbi:MAG: hypothetical protein ACREAK_04040 [Nitrosarchaeum sp.]
MPEYVEFTNFEVEHEPWNEYEIENYGKLRAKLVISRISPIKDSVTETDLSFKSIRIVDFVPYKDKMGTPNVRPYSQEELAKSIVEDDVVFKITNEDWNIYKLPDGKMLRIKPTLVKVSRTDKFDVKGEPIFLVNTQPIVKIT